MQKKGQILIEFDLDKDQPVEAKKLEGVWGLYEDLAKAKEENGIDATCC